jgi:predicted nucleic acid-binding protein
MKKRRMVLDASTAILLAKVDLLRTVAGSAELWMATQAYQEATLKASADAQLIRRLAEEGPIREAKSREPTERFQSDFRLHEGETRSILLAQEKDAVCGTDDGPAICCCKVLGLPFVTAIGILIALREAGAVEEAVALELLVKLERFGRYQARIIEDAGDRIRRGKDPRGTRHRGAP